VPNAAPASGPDASAPAPVAASPEIVALEARLNAEADKRIAGFQRLVAQRDTTIKTLTSQLDDLNAASLSPDERNQAAQKRLAEENAQLRSQIELAELEGEYGPAMVTYRQLLAAGSAKDQLELIKALSAPTPAAPTVAPEVAVPEVDLNNPQRQPEQGVRLEDGSLLTESMADRILGSVGRMADITQRGPQSSSQSGVSEK
jgi:hypothetical protein